MDTLSTYLQNVTATRIFYNMHKLRNSILNIKTLKHGARSIILALGGQRGELETQGSNVVKQLGHSRGTVRRLRGQMGHVRLEQRCVLVQQPALLSKLLHRGLERHKSS